jgi:hypothetical protein
VCQDETPPSFREYEMSLGIAIKGTEGVVLAADSRVTLFSQLPIPAPQGQAGPVAPAMLIPSTFDHATKLLRVHHANQSHVAAVTFGAGAIGVAQPRTARSYMPEFEKDLGEEARLSVHAFAERLSGFFMTRWQTSDMPQNLGQENDMVFFVGGYDLDDAYGTIVRFSVPNNPVPELAVAEGQFGAAWGGQREITDRLLQGFDPMIPFLVEDVLGVPPAQRNPNELNNQLRSRLATPIPWQFLPLQDCVDLAIFLVRTTIAYQRFIVGVRGVGGAIDVATITRDGYKESQAKQIIGEKEHPRERSRS